MPTNHVVHRRKAQTVPIIWRPPFATQIYKSERSAGESILDMVKSVPDLPREFFDHFNSRREKLNGRGYVTVNGEVIPKQYWAYVRPKPYSDERPIVVTMHLALGSGGSGGSGGAKSVVSLVAAFALVIVTGGIAGGALGVPGMLSGIFPFAGGSTSALVLSAATGINGCLGCSRLRG